MTETEKLRNMIDSLINNDENKAQASFHLYSKEKMKNIIRGVDDLSDPIITQTKNDE